jgi:hypothetical protein
MMIKKFVKKLLRISDPSAGEDPEMWCKVVRPQGLMVLAVERPGIPPVDLDPQPIHNHGSQLAMMMEARMMKLISPLPTHPLSGGWFFTGRRLVDLQMSLSLISLPAEGLPFSRTSASKILNYVFVMLGSMVVGSGPFNMLIFITLWFFPRSINLSYIKDILTGKDVKQLVIQRWHRLWGPMRGRGWRTLWHSNMIGMMKLLLSSILPFGSSWLMRKVHITFLISISISKAAGIRWATEGLVTSLDFLIVIFLVTRLRFMTFILPPRMKPGIFISLRLINNGSQPICISSTDTITLSIEWLSFQKEVTKWISWERARSCSHLWSQIVQKASMFFIWFGKKSLMLPSSWRWLKWWLHAPFIMKMIEVVTQFRFEKGTRHLSYTPFWIDPNNPAGRLRKAPSSSREPAAADPSRPSPGRGSPTPRDLWLVVLSFFWC